MTRDQLHRLGLTLARYLFFPAITVVVWGQLRHGAMPPGVDYSDKILHFTAYFGLAGLATLALDGGRKAFYAALALVLLGGAMEIVQGMTGRDAELLDQIANTLGVTTGLAIALGWIWLMRPRDAALAARSGRR